MRKRYGMVIDQERCIGCEACTVACKVENNGSTGWIQVTTQNTIHKDIPEGCFPDLKMHFLPTLCNHCECPLCAEACPLEAIIKNENGIVTLDESACDGCQTCIGACPYDAIALNSEKDKAEKCNFCCHRIENSLEPFCVICCEGQAMHFGDLNDPDSEVSQLLQSNQNFRINPDIKTGPAVYYLPPKEPRGL